MNWKKYEAEFGDLNQDFWYGRDNSLLSINWVIGVDHQNEDRM